MKALIYCRVSTEEQAKQGYSLEAQESCCRAYAERLGYEVIQVFIEQGQSAKTTNRLELQNLLSYCTKHAKSVDALLVYKLDRLSRNMADYTSLLTCFAKLGISVKSATEQIDETPAGKLMKHVVGAFAQFDNDVRAENTKRGMVQALKEGRWVWVAPVGYKFEQKEDKKSYLAKNKESPYIQEIFGLFEKGTYTQAEVIAIMNKKYPHRKLSKQTLNQILRNPLYAGLIKHPWLDETIKGVHERLISEDTFWRVQAILDGRRPTATAKQRNNPDFPLRNFAKCPLCEQRLTGSWSRSRTGKRYPYYHCRTKGCSYKGVRKEEMEEKFYTFLAQLRPSGAVLDLFLAIVEDVWKEKHASQIKERNRIELEIRKLANRKSRVDELMIQGVFDEATYKKQVEQIEQERVIKQLELSEAKIELNNVEACLGYCRAFLNNLAKLWANADVGLKQRFQNLVFPHGIYYGGDSIRTASISPIFKLLQQENFDESKVAPPGGLEPPT